MKTILGFKKVMDMAFGKKQKTNKQKTKTKTKQKQNKNAQLWLLNVSIKMHKVALKNVDLKV